VIAAPMSTAIRTPGVVCLTVGLAYGCRRGLLQRSAGTGSRRASPGAQLPLGECFGWCSWKPSWLKSR
jgi:hypothetical protein